MQYEILYSLILLFQRFSEKLTIMNYPDMDLEELWRIEGKMKSKIIYDASENANDEEKNVTQDSGLSGKDIAKFKRKMDRLLDYLRELVEKANHSEETYQMIQEGLIDVMEWFIPIR